MISTALLFLAQATNPAPGSTKAPDSTTGMMVWMLFAFAMVYFITIRPQQLRAKAAAAQIATTKTGDKVITASGIHGIIANVKDKTFILKIADNVKIEIEKSAVASVIKASEGAAPESNS